MASPCATQKGERKGGLDMKGDEKITAVEIMAVSIEETP